MFSVTSSGSFKNIEKFFQNILHGDLYSGLDAYGQRGVDALASATPVESGLTAHSWVYKIEIKNGMPVISWHNTHVVDGVPIAIIIDYGHGTGTGGWVAGRPYINPTIQPIFDQIADDVWEKVKNG